MPCDVAYDWRWSRRCSGRLNEVKTSDDDRALAQTHTLRMDALEILFRGCREYVNGNKLVVPVMLPKKTYLAGVVVAR
jgi:hypothetical protein